MLRIAHSTYRYSVAKWGDLALLFKTEIFRIGELGNSLSGGKAVNKSRSSTNAESISTILGL